MEQNINQEEEFQLELEDVCYDFIYKIKEKIGEKSKAQVDALVDATLQIKAIFPQVAPQPDIDQKSLEVYSMMQNNVQNLKADIERLKQYTTQLNNKIADDSKATQQLKLDHQKKLDDLDKINKDHQKIIADQQRQLEALKLENKNLNLKERELAIVEGTVKTLKEVSKETFKDIAAGAKKFTIDQQTSTETQVQASANLIKDVEDLTLENMLLKDQLSQLKENTVNASAFQMKFQSINPRSFIYNLKQEAAEESLEESNIQQHAFQQHRPNPLESFHSEEKYSYIQQSRIRAGLISPDLIPAQEQSPNLNQVQQPPVTQGQARQMAPLEIETQRQQISKIPINLVIAIAFLLVIGITSLNLLRQ